MEYKKNDITIEFYQKPGDEKFSFRIKNNEELTTKVLSNVSTKKVKENDIHYCQKAIFDLIEKNKLNQKDQIEMDYISWVKEELDCFTSKKIPFDLKDDYPLKVNQKENEVTYTISFNGVVIERTASNKKIAKQLCYKEIKEQPLIG